LNPSCAARRATRCGTPTSTVCSKSTSPSGGQEVELTPLEFRLLAAFARHPNQLLAHDRLLELAWGGERGTSRDQVKLYVGYLRRKLAAAGISPDAIETVRGFGYRYSPEPV
jgi:DNA-binding response OmpR family regulator